MKSIAFFISPHGFGHAARASAVLHELHALDSSLHFHVVTTVPEWFFRRSLPFDLSLTYHSIATDVGLVQRTPTEEDLPATVRALANLYPLRNELLESLSERMRALKIDAIISDIAPLGIVVANRIGVPSILIENFTWDWIYEPYCPLEPRLLEFATYLRPLFSAASLRIQAQPICKPLPNTLTIAPIARPTRVSRESTRKALSLDGRPAILISMGGVRGNYTFLDKLAKATSFQFAIAGAEPALGVHDGAAPLSNVRFIPTHSPIFHPDLMAACDAVVGKVGYSTVCEAYYGNTQFLYVPRALFPESRVMEDFVTRYLNGAKVEQSAFDDGSWIDSLEELLKPAALNTSKRDLQDGARTAAKAILAL